MLRPATCFVLLIALSLTPSAHAQTISTAPTSGGLGTVLTATMSPPTPGSAFFDGFTSAQWVGFYDAPIGFPDSAQFTIDFNTSQVHISEYFNAKVILGDGASTNGPDPLSLMPGGTFVGTFTFSTLAPCVSDVTTTGTNPGDPLSGVPDGFSNGTDLSFFVENWLNGVLPIADLTTTNTNPGDTAWGIPDGVANGADLSWFLEFWNIESQVACPRPTQVAGPSNTTPTGQGAILENVLYPDGFWGTDPPVLDGEPTELIIYALSNVSDPLAATDENLQTAAFAHVAVVLRLDENELTSAPGATQITVDFVSLSTTGVELDRLTGLVLVRNDNDGDPLVATYTNDLTIPIVLIDVALDRANYAGSVPVQAEDGGSITVLPSTGGGS